MTLRNEVYLNRVTFKNNSAFKAGGGIDIGYIDSASSSPITNHVNIENCYFIANHVSYGGGTGIYAS